jgi:predicted nucleic acid-binding protein
MTRIVVADASVLAAVVFGEEGAEAWAARLDGAAIHAPRLLQYELQSVARKKCQTDPDRGPAIVAALVRALDPRNGITWTDPDPGDVVLVANATGLTAHDASYLCVAGLLGAELATADRRLAATLGSAVEHAGS